MSNIILLDKVPRSAVFTRSEHFEARNTAHGRRRHIQLCFKRLLDIVISAVALLLLAPLLALVAMAVRLDGPGPIFFVQTRFGRHLRPIRVVKFRTMHVDRCDPSGRDQTVENDPRVTRTGAWLRRHNIDELPQLWNVLKGDMSLVGPRCHAIGMLAAGRPYEELVPRYHERHGMRPGMTGLAQVKGLRGRTADPALAARRIEQDIAYVERFSLLLDLRILLVTLLREARGGTGI
ncbi:sugar transferase [Prosthecomicrobium pneumaticum]|uniref:Lipopolysaccharide/colanic/teichoic acid biosynthesis glycosyltransferase n=1 Tax=Prosthecomicrobium pneumaticum TaxID=81895 RepID=A0A7W9FKK5_9HYPH|nr:sugar transferase [Prosthecomicrobium pneumaticum]MBB5752650.1 lipopolysaccharide/colanic/teichoic acid biosynthesis glycosyltransferase [Prosthecomicrobium pneumaticum]